MPPRLDELALVQAEWVRDRVAERACRRDVIHLNHYTCAADIARIKADKSTVTDIRIGQGFPCN